MGLYALKCSETDLPQLIHNAELLGVVAIGEDGKPYGKNGSLWDYIGYKPVGDPPDEGQPDTRDVLRDVNGVPYVHINCITPLDIGTIAAELAVQYPEIAAGLAELPRFFITDAEGQTSWPVAPMRVFL